MTPNCQPVIFSLWNFYTIVLREGVVWGTGWWTCRGASWECTHILDKKQSVPTIASFPLPAEARLAKQATLQGPALGGSPRLPLRERKCLPSPSGWLTVPIAGKALGSYTCHYSQPWVQTWCPHFFSPYLGIGRRQPWVRKAPVLFRTQVTAHQECFLSLGQDNASHVALKPAGVLRWWLFFNPRLLELKVMVYTSTRTLVLAFKMTPRVQFLALWSVLRAASLQWAETHLETSHCWTRLQA